MDPCVLIFLPKMPSNTRKSSSLSTCPAGGHAQSVSNIICCTPDLWRHQEVMFQAGLQAAELDDLEQLGSSSMDANASMLS